MKIQKKYICIFCIFSLIVTFSVIFLLNGKIHFVYYENEKEVTEIRLLSYWNYNDSEGRNYQKLIDEFNEQNPDIHVTNDVQTSEEYFTRLKLDFASNNEPDIFISWPCITVNKYAQIGKIAFLDKYLNEDEKWYDSFDKSIWNSVSYNGSIYALPIENIYTAMFVNKRVFDKCGLPIPTTYDELKSAVSVLQREGYTPIAFDISDSGCMLYKALLARLGGKFYSDRIITKDGYNENYIKAAEMLKELYNMRAFPENLFSVTQNERDNLYLEEKSPIIVRDSRFLNQIYSHSDELYKNTQVCIMPAVPNQRSSKRAALYGISGNNMFVSKKAVSDPQKEEKIKRFLKYMTSYEAAAKLKSDLGAITTVAPNRFGAEDVTARQNEQFIYHFTETISYPHYYVDADEWSRIENRLPMFLEGKIGVYSLFEQ